MLNKTKSQRYRQGNHDWFNVSWPVYKMVIKKNYTCHLSMEIRILVDNQEYPKILVKNMEMMF